MGNAGIAARGVRAAWGLLDRWVVGRAAGRASDPMSMPSAKDEAPVGMTKYSWKGSLFPACEPPLITLKHGTGIISSVLPARSA